MASFLKTAVAAVATTALLSGCGDNNGAKDTGNITGTEYLVTVTRPGTLNLVNMETYELTRQCDVPGGPAPGTIVMSPDNSVAYVLASQFSNVYGIDLRNCEVVFSTQQQEANVQVRSLGSIAISKDGTEIYTHQNRVRKHTDHYESLPSQVAVFDTSAGLNVKASRVFEAPRQITIMDTLDSGPLLLGGPDVYQMDVTSGEYSILIASRSADDPNYAPRDVLTVWPMGPINHQFSRLYSTARFAEPGNFDTAEWLWGVEQVDLATGEASSEIFGPLNAVLFTGVRRPNHPDKIYGILNHLKEFDVPSQTETRSVDLEHTYYCINFSRDGSKVYLSGALNKVAVYDADKLEKLTEVVLPGDGSMANSVVFNATL